MWRTLADTREGFEVAGAGATLSNLLILVMSQSIQDNTLCKIQLNNKSIKAGHKRLVLAICEPVG